MVKVSSSSPNPAHLKLIRIGDILDQNENSSTSLDPLQKVARWCVDYLCNPNPDIGRTGVVCPWSPIAMKKETFWLAEILTGGRNEQDIFRDILSTIDSFNQQFPRDGESTQFKTIVTVLHDIHPESRVNDFHSQLKPAFLEAGLMLGEFFSTCDKPGLRNLAFRPLRSPIPLLVVREMLEFDIAFLADSKVYVKAYLQRHGERGITTIKALLNRSERLGFNQKQIAVLEEALKDENVLHLSMTK